VFTGKPGLQVNIDDPIDPLSYFNVFITDGMLDAIVLDTNIRASQLMAAARRGTRRSRLNNWIDVELRILITVLFYQTLIHKPEQEMYWSTKPLLETPYIQQVMSEQQFNLLMKCLHFVDSGDLPPTTSASEKSFLKIKGLYEVLIFPTRMLPLMNLYFCGKGDSL